MPNVKKGGTTLCRTPFPTSVFPCQIASLQGGTTLCRTPPSPHPFFPAGLPLCRGCDTVSYPLSLIRFSPLECLFAGGVRHCVVPPFPHPFFPARMPLCRGVRHCVAPPLIRYLTIKNRGDFVNQCTLILADGTEIIIDGDLHHIDFSKCSSEEIISFAKQYLAEHHIFTKEGGSSTHE